MSGYRCPLGKLIPKRPDTEKLKTDGWMEHGILVVDASDPRLGPFERQAIINVGNRLYGRRNDDPYRR